MNTYRYFKWDGTEPFCLDSEKLMDELSRRIMIDGNLSRALWDMQNAGLRDSLGRRMPTLDELLRRLQEKKRQQLNRYNLDSVMDDIRKAVEDIIEIEKQGIQKQLDNLKERASREFPELTPEMKKKLIETAEEKANRNLSKLDALPPDVGGRIKELSQYDFTDPDAKRKFDDLMNLLKKRVLENYTREIGNSLRNLDPATLSEIRNMLQALNQMLEQKRRGLEPGFAEFMQQFGHFFGPNPPRNLAELIERLQEQIVRAQSLLNSLSEEQRQELEDIINSVIDEEMQQELAKLAANLQMLNPEEGQASQYSFWGDEPISYSEALKLMEELRKIEKLEDQLVNSRLTHSLDSINREMIREILGEQAEAELEAIGRISKSLEEAGYLRLEQGKYSITPKGMRRIGEKALSTVFARLRKDRAGGHVISRQGGNGDRLEDTKKHEFGDDFDLNIEKTIMNALLRTQTNLVKLDPQDFEIYRKEQTSRSATVLMLDLSLSMPMHGNFQAAKMVAIALDALISSKYPKDSLYILGFSSYARRMSREELTYISWDDFDPYTNMQHAFMVARKVLSKDRCENKQIILISDGEPTAHIEHGHVYFQYPPSLRSIQLTLKEVIRCTRDGIVINTFMLKGRGYYNNFVMQMARLNRGRVFYTTADNLGKYIIVDYISNKKEKIA